jgi:hypothetical protein
MSMFRPKPFDGVLFGKIILGSGFVILAATVTAFVFGAR